MFERRELRHLRDELLVLDRRGGVLVGQLRDEQLQKVVFAEILRGLADLNAVKAAFLDFLLFVEVLLDIDGTVLAQIILPGLFGAEYVFSGMSSCLLRLLQ